MKARIYTLIIILTPIISFSQTTANYQKAIFILKNSINATGSQVPNNLLVTSKGVIHNLGHYEVPGKTKDIPFEETDAFFQKEESGYMRSTMLNNKYSFVELAVIKQDSVYNKGFYENKMSKEKNTDLIFELARKIPVKLLQLAWTSRASLRYLGGDKLYDWVSFGPKPVTLFINKKTQLLEKTEYLAYDNLYGDVIFATEYKGQKIEKGIKMPLSRIDYEYGKPEREVTYGNLRSDVKPDTSDLKIGSVPENFRNKMMESIVTKDSLIFQNIASNIDLIRIESQNNKMLLVEFADYIALFEVPAGIELNSQILEELHKKYPTKPLKYLFVTHHHPDHAGGVRAYTSLPITMVTTIGNQEYFKDLMKSPHSLSNTNTDEVQKLKFDFVSLNGERTFMNKIVAYEIGKATGHTDEHLVYYIPESKLLWTGDLLSFRSDGRITPLGQRGKAVYDLITSKNLAVDKIYTSWPLKGQKEFGTFEDLKKMVEIK
ncbi:MBL fold metallo-hydrolase [Dyadobacter psychrotolerans]|uniref:MBL fold metallo-hydrolase n=1 Tax=Dyadobacter psychrotolerans TaxID=2541721 RepID=A0A4R5DG26_9BACT|nr:MBL fold metallo-hydrolase [Dyadobacter psychrotolerans]TDE12749.1 MBL fold metallo-hydrolase [Dyadobacter psychrotolerans]